MNPNQGGNPLGDPNFDKNPFESVLAQIQSQGQSPTGGMMGGAQQMMGQGAPTPQQPPQAPLGGMGAQMQGAEEIPPNQLVQGQDTSSTPMLIGAVQALQKYIKQEDDSTNISIARSIVALISKLIERDQVEQTAAIPQQQQQLQAMQPPQGGTPPLVGSQTA